MERENFGFNEQPVGDPISEVKYELQSNQSGRTQKEVDDSVVNDEAEESSSKRIGRKPSWSKEKAGAELSRVFDAWKHEQLKTSGEGKQSQQEPFNIEYIKKHSRGVTNWVWRSGISIVSLLPTEAQHEWHAPKNWTLERAQSDIEQAYSTWKELAKKWDSDQARLASITAAGPVGRPQFDRKFVEHIAPGLLGFCKRTSRDIRVLLPDAARADWQEYTLWNEEKAKLALEKLFQLWREEHKLDESIGFNANYIRKKNRKLVAWFEKRGASIMPVLSEEAKPHWTKQEVWTEDKARIELEKIYQQWKKDKSVPFRPLYLIENAEGLYHWLSRSEKRVESLLSPEAFGDWQRQISSEDLERQLQEFANQEIKGDWLHNPSHFQRMIGLFGAESAIDILYAHHPEFKAIPPERVSGIMSQYLGDYLKKAGPGGGGGPGGPDDEAQLLLRDPNLYKARLAVAKNDALNSFLVAKRNNALLTPEYFFKEYFSTQDERIESFAREDLKKIFLDARKYYDEVMAGLPRPATIVDSLRPDRPFPDFYQSINIKELHEKKRLLIADEMGVGKSGSAILAKEYLGCKQALVLAPANVLETWKRYLSDQQGSDGRQIGYFKTFIDDKQERRPKVLIVEDQSDLARMSSTDYDYIVVSHERLLDHNMEFFRNLKFDMLIVDEVHKLKNAKEGKRANNLEYLAKKVRSKEKYLALLSGTPVPNKVEDVAILLKLLHPQAFRDIESSALVSEILNGSIPDIRTRLVPHMQRKSLAEHVEMPQLQEEIIEIEMSEQERSAYELLFEEDDIEAKDKMRILRQYCLNHEMLELAPGVPNRKLDKASELLNEAFRTKDKVLLFTNEYVTDVLNGETAITQRMRLPKDVTVRIVYGHTSKEDKEKYQKEFNEEPGKVLLVVSGDTADVGVDYSGGEHLIFYNEPWTIADLDQQLARVYRPGLKRDLTYQILITKDTIEQGIHDYIATKHAAIEKLLRGFPLTELERNRLERQERSPEANLELNPELAEYYFNSFHELNKMFSHLKEAGEDNFRRFLESKGDRYAECYINVGGRSYQANVSRVSNTLISKMIDEIGVDGKAIQILDIASGPTMLRKHANGVIGESIRSLDINKHNFGRFSPGKKTGSEDVEQPFDFKRTEEEGVVGSFKKLPYKNESFEFANMSLALHYTEFDPRKGKLERMEVLREMNRILKVGGRAVIAEIYSVQYKNREKLSDVLEKFGFRIVEKYSGSIDEGGQFSSSIVTLEKIGDPVGSDEAILQSLTKEEMGALKFERVKNRLKNQRKILSNFSLNGANFDVHLNEQDAEYLEEEQGILAQGNGLKQRFGRVEDIPVEDLRTYGFLRVRVNRNKYVLFKALKKGGGGVKIENS